MSKPILVSDGTNRNLSLDTPYDCTRRQNKMFHFPLVCMGITPSTQRRTLLLAAHGRTQFAAFPSNFNLLQRFQEKCVYANGPID